MTGRELRLFPLRVILRRTLPVALAMMLVFALIAAWDLERWSDIPLEWAVAIVAFILVAGTIGAASIEWDSRRERRRWSVKVSDDFVSITDDKRRPTEIPISNLQVIVAMGSQSAWRDDLSIALFDESDEPLLVFPLVAKGSDRFVGWLEARDGFRASEFTAARESANSAAHVIWMAE